MTTQSLLITDCYSVLVVIFDPQMHPRCLPHTYSRYLTGNVWKIYYLCEIGFLTVAAWVLVYGQIPVKAELVEGVAVFGR